MRTLLVLVLITLFSGNLYAQDTPFPKTESQTQDTIKILSNFWGSTFHQGWRQLKMKELHDITRENPEANKHMKMARAHNTVAGIFGFIGGFAIGWSLADYFIKGEVSPGILIAGGAATLVSIPFSISTTTNTKKAVKRYNYDILNPNTTMKSRSELRLGFTGNGIGLALRF